MADHARAEERRREGGNLQEDVDLVRVEEIDRSGE